MKHLQVNYKNKLVNEPLYTTYRGVFETSLHLLIQMGIHVKMQQYIDQQRDLGRRLLSLE